VTELGPRDDLESLAYVLLFFLRGDLPWQRYSRSTHGTFAGRAAQVRQKKITWTGSMSAGSHSTSFSDLLDSVRSLSFHGNFDYDRWRSTFRKVSCDHGYSIIDDIDWTVPGNAKLIRTYVETHLTSNLLTELFSVYANTQLKAINPSLRDSLYMCKYSPGLSLKDTVVKLMHLIGMTQTSQATIG
jgi:hypothetical protein